MIIDNDSLNSFLHFINLLTVSDKITQGEYIEVIYDNDDSGIRMLMEYYDDAYARASDPESFSDIILVEVQIRELLGE